VVNSDGEQWKNMVIIMVNDMIPSGKLTVCLLKPWPIEIVDLASYKMGGFSIVPLVYLRG